MVMVGLYCCDLLCYYVVGLGEIFLVVVGLGGVCWLLGWVVVFIWCCCLVCVVCCFGWCLWFLSCDWFWIWVLLGFGVDVMWLVGFWVLGYVFLCGWVGWVGLCFGWLMFVLVCWVDFGWVCWCNLRVWVVGGVGII